jgi:uncharacterized linocin/CFP29 family protein
MDRLHRALAPISGEAWRQIDEEAARTLRHYLAGRSLIDVEGPKGWGHSAEARAEDHIIFHGHGPVGIAGVAGASSHEDVPIPDDYNRYPSAVARAVATLKRAAVEGPYAIALGERCYTGVVETTEHGGYPVLEHLRLILGGPVVWAPAVDGAVVLSRRGGDYTFVSGDDFAIGFERASATAVHLYIEESFTVMVREARAAVALVYA